MPIWAFAALTSLSAAHAAEPPPATSTLPVYPLKEIDVFGGAIGKSGFEGSSLTSRDIQDLQLHDETNLSGISPNVIYQGAGDRSYNGITGARGLVNSFYFTDPALTFYVDDVPIALPFTNRIDGDSIYQLDLLKGPQGSLFGQNGPAGIVRVTQFQPTDYWAATSRNEYGSYSHYKTFEQASGPVGHNVDVLASIHYEEQDGFLHNTTLGTRPDGDQEIGGRIAFRWTPNDRLSLDVNVEQNDAHDGVQRFTPLSGPRYDYASQIQGKNDSQSGLQSLKLTYNTDDYRVLFISSHRSYRLHNIADLGFGTAPVPAEITEDPNQYMQELRIESTPASDFKWSGGASYQRVFPSSIVSLETSPGATALSAAHETFDSYAAYGQVEFKPTDKLTLRLGNRIQFDGRSGDRSYTDPAGGDHFDRESHQYLNVAPKLDANYALTEHQSLFASTGLTFRPGGYAPFATATTLQSYGAEKTWANSVGWQADAWEKRLSTSFTLFWNETYNYQLEEYTFPSATVVNAPEVSSRGVEWTLEGKPIEELTLQAQLGYTLATFGDFHDPSTGQSYNGNRVPSIPDTTALFGATYRHPLGWMGHVDYRWFGQTYFDQADSALSRQGSYGLLAARLGYEAKHWSVYCYGDNLTNTQYDTLISTGLSIQFPGDPRTVGVGVDLKW